jgi:multidrug efflux pump subunit AcrB
MNLATWSIHNPIPSILLFTLLSIAGIYGFQHLTVKNMPDMELPIITISLTQPGAVPSQLETEVARKVEDALANLTGIQHITTRIRDNLVSINASFALEKNLNDALFEVKAAVDGQRANLPINLEPAVISAVSFNNAPMLTYAISSTLLDEEALSWYVDNTLGKAIMAIPGVGRFERLGGVNREINVEVDPVRLASLGITASEVSKALRQVHQETSGGRGNLGLAEQAVHTIATVSQANDLSALPIPLSNGTDVRLDQLATVRDSTTEPTQAARLDGKSALGFNIFPSKGADETRTAIQVASVLKKFQQTDNQFTYTLLLGSVKYIQEQYHSSMMMLFEGSLLAVLVVWWFLRDWRATLVSASALPLSILPTFAMMYWLDFSLNMLTLLALAIVVGILVDDAIVEIENIARHVRQGKSIRQAAEDAVTEIALAVIATTMTLVVVFMPTAAMSGISGMLFRQFGWTAVVAVLASLLVARLITPMLAVYFLKNTSHAPEPENRLMRSYLATVLWTLRQRRTTIVLSFVFFISTLSLLPILKSGFIPDTDEDYSIINFELQPGSTLTDGLSAVENIRLALANIAGIQHIFATLGTAQTPNALSSVNKGSVILNLAELGHRLPKAPFDKALRQALQNVPGIRFSLLGGKLSLLLSSDNNESLKHSAQALERELRALGRFGNISSAAELERPEIVIRPDLQHAADLGITAELIGETVRIATSGDFNPQLAKLTLDQRQLDIRVRMAESTRVDPQMLANLRIRSRYGLVPLGSVATLSLESGAAQIDRQDRRRNITINADLAGMPLGEAMKMAMDLPAIKNLPADVQLIHTGSAEVMNEIASGFGLAMLTGILCVFCVLVLLFKDFFQPLTILSAIPLSLGGAFVALLVCNSELDVSSMIGIVMLVGIVTKNSILLVEYTITGMQKRGLDMQTALLEACRNRARPILMTTVAMIAGMLPIALGLGADSGFRQPMAIAVIGGLICSNFLCLLVIPVVFTYVHQFEMFLLRLFNHPHPQPNPSVLINAQEVSDSQ